jgi:hypothetical protein
MSEIHAGVSSEYSGDGPPGGDTGGDIPADEIAADSEQAEDSSEDHKSPLVPLETTDASNSEAQEEPEKSEGLEDDSGSDIKLANSPDDIGRPGDEKSESGDSSTLGEEPTSEITKSTETEIPTEHEATTPDRSLSQDTANDNGRALEEKTTDAKRLQDTPLSEQDEQINDSSEPSEGINKVADVPLKDRIYETKPAVEMVTPEEYSQYKDIYDSLDKLDVSQDYKNVLVEKFKAMDTDLKGVYNKHADQLKCNDSNFQGTAKFDPDENGFKFDHSADLNNPLGQGNKFFHESGHMIDRLGGQKDTGVQLSDDLNNSINQDYNDAISKVCGEFDCDSETAKIFLSGKLSANPNASNVVSDAFGGLSQNEVHGKWGHDTNYWNERGPDAVWKETFAGITANRACGNKESIEFTNTYMPKTMLSYNTAIKKGGQS